MIDLRSDTVTKPTQPMLEAMMKAEVGDDVFQEDKELNALQEKAAAMFKHEAALFCPSGTMTNQLGIKAHTQPGEEIICARNAHIYRYEGGGPAFNSGLSVYPLEADRGRFKAEEAEEAITPNDVHKPQSRLVVVENTSNQGGGSIWSIEAIKRLRKLCNKYGLALHLDGARLFNALVEQGTDPETIGPLFDSISICLSKGLGAPVGSLLIGKQQFIRKAHRFRKVMGGGMRQAGYLAAAGIYALDNHVERLNEDHQRAQALGKALAEQEWIETVLPIETNIVVGKVAWTQDVHTLLAKMKEQGILAVPFGGDYIRMVTHLGIGDKDIEQAIAGLHQIEA